MEQQRNAQLQAQLLRNNLRKEYPDLESLEREKDWAQKNGKDKSFYDSEIDGFELEVGQIKQRTTELKEKLEQIPELFPYVDEPIRRFLLYGGDTARDFLVQSVQMANHTIKEQKVPSAYKTGLPERVVTRFKEWWEEYDRTNGERDEDEIIGPVLQERFRSPVIYLDTAIAEIRVHFFSFQAL